MGRLRSELRIGIDLTALLPEATGVDTYLLELVEGLAAVDRHNQYVVFVNREDHEPPARPAGATSRSCRVAIRNRLVRLGWQQAALPSCARAPRAWTSCTPRRSSCPSPIAGRGTSSRSTT